MKELTYKSANNILFSFRKSSIWQRSFTSPFFSEDNIEVSSTLFSDAIDKDKCEEDLWCVKIDWRKVDMKCREVPLTIYVSYSGAAKITEDFIIKYPVRTVSFDDFDISLSPQTALWGTEGKVCTFNIQLKQEYKPWMYVDSSFKVGLDTVAGRGFHPVTNDLSKPFNLGNGCSIDLKYIGYDTEKPIKDNEIRGLRFDINGVNVGKPLAFTFTPRPYSYRFEVIKTKEKYYYGDSDRKLFRIQLVREDPLSPIADTVKIEYRFNNILSVNDRYIEVKPGVSYEKLLNGVKDTFLICDIDNGNCLLREEIEIGKIEKQANNYVRVVSGVKPGLQLIQNIKDPVLKADQKLLFYCGENNECQLVIKNNCDEIITISAMSAVLASDDSSKLFSIREKKQRAIKPKEESKFTISVDTSIEMEDRVLVTVWTKETESATINYDLIIKKRPHAIITIEPIEVEEKNRLVVGNAYLMGWYCLTRCLVGYDKNSPFDSEKIDLKEIDFSTNYKLSDKDTEKGLIPKNKREEVNLMFNVPDYFKNDDKIVHKDNQYFLECNWEYHGQIGAIQVPVIMPKLYGKKMSFFQDKKEIIFPQPNEGRVIKVFECTFKDLNDKDSDIRWDKNQKLSVESPFSFSDSGIVKEKAITPGEVVPFYLHVNEIDGIDENTKNINERIIVSLCSTISAENHPSEPLFMYGISGEGKKEKVNPEIVLLPIEAKAKRQVLFRTNNTETRLIKNSRTPVLLRIQQETEDVKALLIGALVVRNVEEIPYKNNGVRFIVKTLSLKDNNIEILHPMTVCPSSCITILNGESEVSLPIYIDYQKWKEVISDDNFVLRFELSPIKEVKENDNDVKGVDDTVYYYEAEMELTHVFIDDVYSLDLGTTGIVVAKEKEDGEECVILEDVKDNPIEKDKEILSSHIMIKVKETGNGEGASNETAIVLAPAADVYYGNGGNGKRFRLVPSKFIIGQEKIPFLSAFYDDDSISKKVKLFNNNKNIDISLTGTEQDGKNISELISCLYKEIFYRMNKEIDKVKKLVITYPNTYTIDILNAIKSIMVDDLGLKKNGQISFVPESDAVAAYYFDQKIVFNNGFLDEKGKPAVEETVVFYDMGAGTLDLSLVKFKRKGEGSFVANIINKIGIPLAGNYLDYIIFKTLRDGGWIKQKMEEKHNAIKELTLDIKVNYKKDTPIGDLHPTWLSENLDYFDNLEEFKKKTYKKLFGDVVAGFLTACSKTVLNCLIPNGEKVNVVVFSGRGSQFLPLREKVVEHLKKMGNNSIKEIQLKNTNNGDCLKTCVAIGALKYQSYFNSDGPFKIENKNLYSKMAIVYFGKEKCDVVVRYLIDPLKEDWEGVDVINGTQCKEFIVDDTISDFIPGKKMYFIQTCLEEEGLIDLYRKIYRNDSSAKDDLNWAFVNLLFPIPIEGNEPIPIKLRISKENMIVERIIGKTVRSEVKLLENVENNLLYKRSMWPFITKLD